MMKWEEEGEDGTRKEEISERGEGEKMEEGRRMGGKWVEML